MQWYWQKSAKEATSTNGPTCPRIFSCWAQVDPTLSTGAQVSHGDLLENSHHEDNDHDAHDDNGDDVDIDDDIDDASDDDDACQAAAAG